MSSLAAFTIIAKGWEYFYLCKAKNTRWLTEKVCCNRVIHKATLSSPCLWACFHSPIPSLSDICKVRNFIKSQYEMLKLISISRTMFESNYSSCTGRRSENIWSSTAVEAVRKKRKDKMKLSLPPKLLENLVWVLVILFCKMKLILPPKLLENLVWVLVILFCKMKLNLPPKLLENLVWVLVILFCKTFFHSELTIWCPIMPKLAVLAP